MSPWLFTRRFLRRPAVILGELTAIAGAGALAAMMPDLHIFQSVWFALVALFAAASLAVVVSEQFRRVCSLWRQQPSFAQFESAPFRTEFERPTTTANPQQRIWSERRLSLAGPLVFHVGLLLLILAGAWRALFLSEAAVDLLEGETLAPNAAWSVQWPGVLGRPFQLDQPLTLEFVSGGRYPDGNLRDLRVKSSTGEIAVNQHLQLGANRLYLTQEFGPAALMEWNSNRLEAVLLADNGHGHFSGEAAGPGGLRVFLRSHVERPSDLELRVMRGNVLLTSVTLGIGETIALPGGERLTLRSTPMWARLRGNRDSALWLAYTGMGLAIAGAAMMFGLVKLDFCVIVTPLGEREKVLLALKPQRFAPLFQERFERFVREQRDPGSSRGNEAQVSGKPKPSLVGSCSLGRLGTTSLLLGSCLALASGCGRVSQTQAWQFVERYNQVVSEAYRRGDVRLIDPVVGPSEGKKLTGLIGVRLDLGITLDSQLLSLEVTGVKQAKNELRVSTRERWSYRDLRIGTGEQVGEASQDSYAMTYYFTNINNTWLVDEIKFTAPPQVGRTNTPWIADRSALQDVTAREAKR
jgi:hypothetical protein